MSNISGRDAYGKVLLEMGEDKRIIVLDADVSKATRTNYFAKKYPDRFFNVGVAEQNLMGVAAGFAADGWIPVVSTFAVFASGRAFDQIRNTICNSNLNVKIVATHAGITVGADGSSHQSVEDIALMRSIPGMVVIVPADANETVNVSDAVRITNFIFVGGAAPDPFESGDTNCDGTVNISDVVVIINFVFVGGNAPCDANGDDIPDC